MRELIISRLMGTSWYINLNQREGNPPNLEALENKILLDLYMSHY